MRDYSRKQTQDRRYQDTMSIHPAKSIWNRVLEGYPGNAEFSSKPKVPIQSVHQRLIKQSERKKPYRDGVGYREMEDTWEGPGGGLTPPEIGTNKFDQIWNMQTPGGGTCILHVFSSGSYCADSTETVIFHGNHPIYGLEFVFPNLVGNLIFQIIDGIGTNTVTTEFIAGANPAGIAAVRAYLQAGGDGMEFCHGWTETSVWSGLDCVPSCESADELIPADGDNPTTIAPGTSSSIGVIGGVGPYGWSVSGTGFSLDEGITETGGNLLIAGVGACGTGTVQVTDSCGEVTSFGVRSTTGTWVILDTSCSGGGEWTSLISPGGIHERLKYEKRQWTTYSNCHQAAVSCGEYPCNGYCSGSECVQLDCAHAHNDDAGWSGSWPCCHGYSTCRSMIVNSNVYSEWRCA